MLDVLLIPDFPIALQTNHHVKLFKELNSLYQFDNLSLLLIDDDSP
jgi:hypothetical protein